MHRIPRPLAEDDDGDGGGGMGSSFLYHDSKKPLASQRRNRPGYSTVALPARALFEHLGGGGGGGAAEGREDDPAPASVPAPAGSVSDHLYASVDLDGAGLEQLRAGLGAFPGVFADELVAAGAARRPAGGGAPSVMVHLWAGTPNATAPMHFDDSHNVQHQLIGVKRFWLLPPSAHGKLHLHPASHPGDRQSRLPWLPGAGAPAVGEAARASFPGYAPAEVAAALRLAELRPGETLLLPALWFHHVVAGQPSFPFVLLA